MIVENINQLSQNGMRQLKNYIHMNSKCSLDSINLVVATTCDEDYGKFKHDFDDLFSSVIQIPSLGNRPLIERYQLIEEFLIEEAKRINVDICAESELLYCLLLFECKYNVSDLKLQIKQACVNAYTRWSQDSDEHISLYLSDFNIDVRKGFLYYQRYKDELDKIIRPHIVYIYTKDGMPKYEHHKKRDYSIDNSSEELKKIESSMNKEVNYRRDTALLTIFTGAGIADSLRSSVRSYNGISNILSLDIPFGQDSADTYNSIKKKIIENREYKSFVVIFDSIIVRQMLHVLSLELKMQIKGVYFPLVGMANEWARKSTMPYTSEQLSNEILEDLKTCSKIEKKVIVALSTKEEGMEKQLVDYLEKYNKDNSVKVIGLAISDDAMLKEKLLSIMDEYVIDCIIGTYDPKIVAVPYIPVSKVLGKSITRIGSISSEGGNDDNYRYWDMEKEEIYQYLLENLSNVDMTKARPLIESLIVSLKNQYVISKSTEIGLIMHISCGIDKMIGNDKMPIYPNRDEIIKKYYEEYKNLRKLIKPIENKFRIIVSDDEFANLLAIVKKLYRGEEI